MLASLVQNPWIAGITPNKMPGNKRIPDRTSMGLDGWGKPYAMLMRSI